MNMATLLPTAMVAACLSSMALAQQAAPSVSTIRVTGHAILQARPNRVEIDLGVVTQGSQAGPTAAEDAVRLEAVLAALRKAVGDEADIKTVSYALTPNYRYPPDGAEPEIAGYTATNIVHVALDDLKKMGTIIDVATRSGANRVQDVRFTLRDPDSAHVQALREAAAKARAHADALASALGLKVSRVLSVEEGSGYAVPIRPVRLAVARAEVAAEPTPIEAGTLDVNASVILTVQVNGQHSSAG
jgi:uncharacterized protein